MREKREKGEKVRQTDRQTFCLTEEGSAWRLFAGASYKDMLSLLK